MTTVWIYVNVFKVYVNYDIIGIWEKTKYLRDVTIARNTTCSMSFADSWGSVNMKYLQKDVKMIFIKYIYWLRWNSITFSFK